MKEDARGTGAAWPHKDVKNAEGHPVLQSFHGKQGPVARPEDDLFHVLW